ncbi:MAG TPA: ammonium transporter [Candidatus Sulfotelmatobacter sp.]|nr:ammonium transporter [Candidatus Sulfotelmatobacter sp.]
MPTRMALRSFGVALLLAAALGAAQAASAQEPAARPAPAPAAPAQSPPAPGAPSAQASAKVDPGDTAWMLTSAAFVLMMTAPGLALFYGGMVRRKNALSTLMQSFIILAIISLQWALWGYSVAFGPDAFKGILGGFEWIGLRGVGLDPNPDYAKTIPHQAFMVYQMMFAVITPALITGAFAERIRFAPFLVFTLLWATFIYDPLAHWVWGNGGWMRNMGALDFAGGTVVHISSGVSALAMALIIGKRRGFGHEPMPPHNLTLTVLGAGLLWVGWFGFNAGSALGANALAVSAFVATHVATAAAAVSWMLWEWAMRGKPTVLGAASGAVAGLVAVTPASGFVTPMAALVIGAVAGILCYSGCVLKVRLGYDDSLDVVGVHGVGGTWGALATGLFATKVINPDGANGLFYGNPQQFAIQALTVLATWAFAFLGTLIIGKAVDAVMGLRVHEEDEHAGLDLSQHNENAYALGMMGEGGHLAGHGLPAGPMGHPADESRHARPAPAGRPPA